MLLFILLCLSWLTRAAPVDPLAPDLETPTNTTSYISAAYYVNWVRPSPSPTMQYTH